MHSDRNARRVEWQKGVGYTRDDEIRFIQRLAATEPMKFFAYAETIHLRTRWGRIDRQRVVRRIDQLLAARQPQLSVAA